MGCVYRERKSLIRSRRPRRMAPGAPEDRSLQPGCPGQVVVVCSVVFPDGTLHEALEALTMWLKH